MSELYCGTGRTKLYVLMEALREAIIQNNQDAIEQAKVQLKEYRRLCGSPLNDQEIKNLIGIDSLEPAETRFIEEAPELVLRSLTDGNLRESIRTFDAFRHYIKPKTPIPEGFIAMLESASHRRDAIIERNAEPSDFEKILRKHFRPDLKARMTRHEQVNLPFFKYHDKPEYPQKTNREIQEEMKGEKKNE